MKRKILFTLFVAITVSLLMLLLIGLYADGPRRSNPSRGHSHPRGQPQQRNNRSQSQHHSRQQQRPQHHQRSRNQHRSNTPQSYYQYRSNQIPQVSRSPSMSRSEPRRQPQSPRRQQYQQKNAPRGQAQPHNRQAQQQTRNFRQQNRSHNNRIQPATPATSGILNQQRSLSRRAEGSRRVIKQRHPRCDQWFGDGFFQSHDRHPYFHNQGDNWWWAPSWIGISSWLPWGWNSAVYYTDSGYGYTMPPNDYQNTQEPYERSPQDDWMPLGVFAAGQSPSEASYTSMFVQLALGKDGALAGTYFNSATNEVHDLDGSVDQYTQEAVWKVSDNPDSPTMTTGLYNLTQDASTVQVHFLDGTVQPWTFIRLNK